MVLPQYTFAALAFGAIAAIAVTLYATLGTRRSLTYSNGARASGSGCGGDNPRRNKYRQKKCEICHQVGDLMTIHCGHNYHKSCFMNLHGPDMPPECPESCVVCWEKITKDSRADIENVRNAECSICLDEIDRGSLVLECGHEYHTHCANTLIQHDRKCPNCRVQLTRTDLRRIIASL